MKRSANFVLFVTDQHRADDLGCYGHPVLETPHIDGIAARGICYDAFHVASPVCMPNRASLMTGRMPSVHGVRMNGMPLATDNVTFVDSLRDAGYRTALVGKSHLQNFTSLPAFGKATVTRPGFFRAEGLDAQAIRRDLHAPVYGQELPSFWADAGATLNVPFYGFQQVDLVIGHGDGCGGDYARWVREREPDVERLLGPAHQLPHDYVCPQAFRTALPEALHPTRYIAARAAAFVERAAAANDDTPFFLMVSFPDPHHPFCPPGRHWDRYRPEDMPVPPVFSRNSWTPPPHVAALWQERADGDAAVNGMNSIGCSRREALEARALTCGMIAMVDDAIGDVVHALEAAGLDDSTVLAFTSDHGDHLGDHGLLLKGAEPYRQITRVPFIWADPDGPSGVRSDALGQTIDIAPTVLERARVEPFVGMQGRDLMSPSTRDALLIQYDHQRDHPGLGGPPRVHTLVDRHWRMSLYDGQPWGELYDLTSDPDEFDNRWDDAGAAAEKARLMERMLRAEIDTVDRVPLPTGRA